MAYASHSHRVETGLSANWFSGLVEAASTWARQRRVYYRTMQELSTMTDADLNDLGLNRTMFRKLASECARAN